MSSDAGWRNVQSFRGVLIGNPAFLTLEECHRLIPLLSPDFRLLVLAALFTGGRLMEISRLAAQDFHAGAGSIHFAPGKTKVARHVALSEEGCRFFAARVQDLMATALIFRRLDGQPWRAADPCHRLISPCQQAGLRHITFHAFHHTYASILVMAGTPIAVVAKNLGHQHVETCERYDAHLSRGYVADEIRARMPSFGAMYPLCSSMRNVFSMAFLPFGGSLNDKWQNCRILLILASRRTSAFPTWRTLPLGAG